jgi:hypothetical protein
MMCGGPSSVQGIFDQMAICLHGDAGHISDDITPAANALGFPQEVITVDIAGGRVYLSGTVRNYHGTKSRPQPCGWHRV